MSARGKRGPHMPDAHYRLIINIRLQLSLLSTLSLTLSITHYHCFVRFPQFLDIINVCMYIYNLHFHPPSLSPSFHPQLLNKHVGIFASTPRIEICCRACLLDLLHRRRFRTLVRMVSARYQHGIRMVSGWYYYGSSIVLVWLSALY